MQFPKVTLAICALALGAAGSLGAADNSAQSAARVAMAQKLFELSARQSPVTNAVPAQTAAVVQPVKTCPAHVAPVVAPVKVESKASSAAAKKAEKAAANEWYPGKDTGLPPLAAPASPLTPAQESKLQALLEKYQADQLTSEQYQQQRAAILAAP